MFSNVTDMYAASDIEHTNIETGNPQRGYGELTGIIEETFGEQKKYGRPNMVQHRAR